MFRFFSSLKLAVVLILSLAIILAVGTVVESIYGMRGAHVLVYGTAWFYGVLLLLGTNVLCAALSRVPWRRHQTGFVITHTGILVILIGSVLTMQFGVDGNLPVVEKTDGSSVSLNELTLSFVDETLQKTFHFSVPESAVAKEGSIMEVDLPLGLKLRVDKFFPRAYVTRQIGKSPLTGVGRAAVKVELYNKRFRIEEWLLADHPAKPTELALGPAVLSLTRLWEKSDEMAFLNLVQRAKEDLSNPGYVMVRIEGREMRFAISDLMKGWISITGSPFEIKGDRYFSYAIVNKDKLVNKSKEPVNPAIQVTIRNREGFSERHTVFANFPDLGTLHRSHTKTSSFGLEVKMVSLAKPVEEMGMVGKGRGKLEFAVSSNGRELLYRVYASNGTKNASGKILQGNSVATGWMDLEFKVTDWYPWAIDKGEPTYVESIAGGEGEFVSGIHVRLEKSRGIAEESIPLWAGFDQMGEWLLEGSHRNFTLNGRRYVLNYGRERLDLPFKIHLDKFNVGMDPGTQKAATYESDVVVKDIRNGLEKRQKISMNEPLVYGGYTFYQASYQLAEGQPPVSVFAVNRDPGRWVKYAGSLIMVLGILLMFYLNPHYWDILLKRRSERV